MAAKISYIVDRTAQDKGGVIHIFESVLLTELNINMVTIIQNSVVC